MLLRVEGWIPESRVGLRRRGLIAQQSIDLFKGEHYDIAICISAVCHTMPSPGRLVPNIQCRGMTHPSRDTRISLLERIKAGDQEAWVEFARKYVVVLEQWCSKWGIQDSDSQDVIQDTLLAVVIGVSNFQRRGPGSFRAWMKTIAWRCWCDALTKAERRQDPELLKVLHQSRLPYEELEDVFEKLSVQELLQTSMERVRQRVEPKSWDAFHMTAFQSRPAFEVAELLNLNVDAVYATRCRIQRMITQEYKRLDEE